MQVVEDSQSSAIAVSSWSRLLVIAMTLSAFSPYLGTALNIRYEHLVFYLSSSILLFLILRGRRLWISRSVVVFASCWLLLGALCTLNTWGRSRSGLPGIDPVAAADAFLLPFAIFLVAYALGQSAGLAATLLLRTAAAAVVLGLSLNSILIVAVDVADATPFLRNFWANPASGLTPVAELALLGDRYGGVFNQPFDGGVGYTVGVAAWVYLWRGVTRSTVWGWVLPLTSLVLVVAGGVSTQSKVFVYGALLVVVITFVSSGLHGLKHLTRNIRVLLVVGVALFLAGFLGLVQTYDRSLGMLNYFTDASGLVGVTGGRTASVDGYVDRFVATFSWLGDGWSGALDDSFLAYLSGAGIVGLLLFGVAVGALIAIARVHPKLSPERTLGVSLIAFMAMAALGAVAFQTNRGSTLFWILMGLVAASAPRAEAGVTDLRPRLSGPSSLQESRRGRTSGSAHQEV